MKRFALLMVAMVALVRCDQVEKLCLPSDASAVPAVAAGPDQPAEERAPSHVVVILDTSQGMAGFVRQASPNPVTWKESEFTRIVRDLSKLPHETAYVLPDAPAKGGPAPIMATIDIKQAAGSRYCGPNLGSCPTYLNHAYVSSFINAASRGDMDQIGASLKPGSDDVVLLVTDLQPDVPPEDSHLGTIYLQTTFKTVLDSHLAVGILPTVSDFYGTVYDTEQSSSEPGKARYPLLTQQDHQPFFLIPMGKEEYVRWTLHRLQELRDRYAPASNDFSPVVFANSTPRPSADPFTFRLPTPAGLQTGQPPAAVDDFNKLTPTFLVLRRSADSNTDSVLEYRARPLSAATNDLPYLLRIATPPEAARVWVYLGGPYAARACTQRWSHGNPGIVQATVQAAAPEAAPRAGGDSLLLSFSARAKQSLLVNAIYYIEQDVEVTPRSGKPQTPKWVADWSVKPGSIWQDVYAKRDQRAGHVAIGVNSLDQLFGAMETPQPEVPQSVTLRFALRVEGN